MDTDLIRGLRIRKRITQEVMADRLGISQGTYSKIERGRRGLEAGEALAMIEVLGPAVRVALGEDEDDADSNS